MTIPLALAIIGVTLVVGSLLYLWAARHSPAGGRGERTPTNVYVVTGGAMSLLIAFTMSMTFSQYLSAQQASEQEAAAVLSMSRAATFMQPSLRDPLRNQLVCYAQEVIDLEWPSMRAGSTVPLAQVRSSINQMDAILAADPNAAGVGLSSWESANQQRWSAHLQRLNAAGDGVPGILWVLLIAGSLITIGSLFVFADSEKPGWGHAIVIIGPLFVASAALVVIDFFDHPYADTSGGIAPTAMQTTLVTLTQDRVGDIPLASCPTGS